MHRRGSPTNRPVALPADKLVKRVVGTAATDATATVDVIVMGVVETATAAAVAAVASVVSASCTLPLAPPVVRKHRFRSFPAAISLFTARIASSSSAVLRPVGKLW
jgi:hypothetical protein